MLRIANRMSRRRFPTKHYKVNMTIAKIIAAPALAAFAAACSAAFAAAAPAMPGGGIQSATAEVRAGSLPLAWNTGGPKCMEMPEWQIHEYNPDLYILRQSGCTDFEKPFIRTCPVPRRPVRGAGGFDGDEG